MLRSNSMAYILVASALIFILTSCSKPEQEKSKIPEDQVRTDSLQNHSEPYVDTITKNAGNLNKDSANELKAKEKKRRNDSLRAAKKSEVKILAYYFHPTARCVTCRNIEAYSYEAIQEWEKKNKMSVTWNELNIEDSLNEHYINEFSLQFSSLVIVKYVGGKKDKWKNLEGTWKLVNDKSSFMKYVMHELNQLAKEKSLE